jgi:anthranilate synthase component 1
MGSSPESQLVVEGQTARLNPIAGTYKRTGDEAYDQQQALALAADPKENAEHTMLVDLARNDLSRFAHQVEVKALKGNSSIQSCHSPGIYGGRKATGKGSPPSP